MKSGLQILVVGDDKKKRIKAIRSLREKLESTGQAVHVRYELTKENASAQQQATTIAQSRKQVHFILGARTYLDQLEPDVVIRFDKPESEHSDAMNAAWKEVQSKLRQINSDFDNSDSRDAQKIGDVLHARQYQNKHTSIPNEPGQLSWHEFINTHTQSHTITLENQSLLLLHELSISPYVLASLVHDDPSGKHTPLYVPPGVLGLNQSVGTAYSTFMQHCISLHMRILEYARTMSSDSVMHLLQHAQRVLPLAAQQHVVLSGSFLGYTQLIQHLDNLPHLEAKYAVKQVRENLKSSTNSFNKLPGHRNLKTGRFALQTETIADLSIDLAKVTLINRWPVTEREAGALVRYEGTALSLKELAQHTDEELYEEAQIELESAIESALSQVLYRWEILGDHLALHTFQSRNLPTTIIRQGHTPRFGFTVPIEVEELSLGDEYESCFDKSLELFSTLQRSDHAHAAPYVVMRGHASRWICSTTGKDLLELWRYADRAGDLHTMEIINRMTQCIADVHPTIGRYLSGHLREST